LRGFGKGWDRRLYGPTTPAGVVIADFPAHTSERPRQLKSFLD
jgi:hypothetical protein